MKEIPRTPYNIMKSSVDNSLEPTPEEIKKINSFFLVRYISNDPASIYIANTLNCMHNIPMEAQYKFVLNSTLDKVAFINYPKKEKSFTEKEVKVVASHFKTNSTVAKEYIEVMGIDKTKDILSKYEGLVK